MELFIGIAILIISLAIPFGIAAGIGYLFGRTRRSAVIGVLAMVILLIFAWVIRLAEMVKF